MAQQSRNEERVFWRNLPRQALIRAMLSHLAVLAGKSWRRWQEGNLLPFLCGRLQVIGDLPDILRHRQWLRSFASLKSVESWNVEASFWGKLAV